LAAGRSLNLKAPAVQVPTQGRLGWLVAALSTVGASYGLAEGVRANFESGWFRETLVGNLLLACGRYMAPGLMILAAAAVGLAWHKWGALAHFALAPAAWWVAAEARCWAPAVLVALGVVWRLESPRASRRLWVWMMGVPLVALLFCGAEPGWRALHRFDDGILGARIVEGNGVKLLWAPAGPGWSERGMSYPQAQEVCARLNESGHALEPAPVNLWRLATLDETVRSLERAGSSAGGEWDAVRREAKYRILPEKESPLWRIHSPVTSYWTKSPAGGTRNWQVTARGGVDAVERTLSTESLGCRCVRDLS
jgi:hypothetical protein